MKCPYCGFNESRVIDSRPTEEGTAVRRRRECLDCQQRFTTYEKIEEVPLIVIKKDGSREIFKREKILKGIIKACEKRPISLKTLEKVADDVEKELKNTMEREITSEQIGEMVMEYLKDIDEVAYVRFASVYREFKDVNTFMEELKKILQENK
ncbi:MAG: transcriptional repressor NrdR [Thermosediminibacterales bacterium]|jgi:transcriptional repressor NrdR|nr:transcriptional repressor NrdR [Thermosediminibacterales bacterium]